MELHTRPTDMTLRPITFLATAFGLLFTATSFAATGDIALYLSPDATTPAFLQVPASDARQALADPIAYVLDRRS